MRLDEFPDLNWIRTRANDPQSRFKWPNCVLTIKTKEASRPNIKGPLSFFSVDYGTSFCETNGRLRKIESNSFFLSNEREAYSLYVDEKQDVQTTNIHFREGLPQEVWDSMSQKPDKLISQMECEARYPALFSKLYTKDLELEALLRQLKALDRASTWFSMQEEELCGLIVQKLFLSQEEALKPALSLSSIRSATRVELLRRLYLAVDHIQSNLAEDISLDELARLSTLSKFHFIRCFKAAFGISPYQFIKRERLKRAEEAIRSNTSLNLSSLAYSLGFQNLSSFSRAFHQQFKASPSLYRNLV